MWKYIAAALVAVLIGVWQVCRSEDDLRSRSLAFTAMLSLAIGILVFPYYHLADDLPIAVIESIRAGLSGIAMGVDGDIPYAIEMKKTEFLTYRFLLYGLYIIGPLAGSLFLFSFSSTMRALFSSIGQKRFHVFSSLNEESLMIAESILKEKDGIPVFCSSKDGDEDLQNEAKGMNALCLMIPVERYRLHKNKKYEFYILEEDEHETLVKASSFCSKLTGKKNYSPENVVVRVFASDAQRELLLNLDKQYAGKVFLRHINVDRSLAIQGMFLCMDEAAVRQDCDVALIADSSLGIEFLKDLICLLIKPEGRSTLSLIGPKASSLHDSFLKEAPEADRYKVNVLDCPYGREREALAKVRYPEIVFVLYEDDEKAYDTAVRLMRDLSAGKDDLVPPKIYCCLDDHDLHRILKEENIVLFGDLKTFYTYRNLVNPELEDAAWRVHVSYLSSQDVSDADREEFHKYQNQEASFAEALALCFKKRYILSFKDDDSLTDEEFIDKWLSDEENLQKMGDAEHERWNAYQRVHGWRKASPKQTEAIIRKYDGKRANDPDLKLHPAIVENSQLAACERRVNRLMEKYGSEKRVNYVDADKAIVRKLNEILK